MYFLKFCLLWRFIFLLVLHRDSVKNSNAAWTFLWLLPVYCAWKWKWSHVRLFATPWTVAHQASPSMGFSKQEYWSGVPLPSPIQRLGTTKVSLWCWGCWDFSRLQCLLSIISPWINKLRRFPVRRNSNWNFLQMSGNSKLFIRQCLLKKKHN